MDSGPRLSGDPGMTGLAAHAERRGRASPRRFSARRRLRQRGWPHSAVRALGRRQDLAGQRHSWPHPPGPGPYRHRRHRVDRQRARHLCADPPAPSRLCVPGRPPLPASDRAAEPAIRPLVRPPLRQTRALTPRRGRARHRSARHRRPARPPPGEPVGRREAARRDRPRAPRASAPAGHGRAAGLARRGAQGRDPALYRAAARRDPDPDRLCQPPGRRGREAGNDPRCAVGGPRRRDGPDRRDHGPDRSLPADSRPGLPSTTSGLG
jgi:hypothetical protein